MELHDVISTLRSKFDSFNLPASADHLSELEALLGSIPEDVRALYRDHDGSNRLPESAEGRLAARLMPISEVIEIHRAMAHMNAFPKVGEIALLWTDDNSNYCGIHTNGLLSGWLSVLDHEESMLTPAFRSIASFMSRLLNDGGNIACDIPSLPREIPEAVIDAVNLQKDRTLSSLFRERYNQEVDEDLRRLFAFCAICLTPVQDTKDVMNFLADADMWTPEAAVRLLEVRQWRGEVEQLEKLAREGKPNGDGAAMRLLARMNTNLSRQAIARLRQALQGQKLQSLKMWVDRRLPLQPPRW